MKLIANWHDDDSAFTASLEKPAASRPHPFGSFAFPVDSSSSNPSRNRAAVLLAEFCTNSMSLSCCIWVSEYEFVSPKFII